MGFCFACVFHELGSHVSKYVYGILYLTVLIIAWLIRDQAGSAFRILKKHDVCDGRKDCVGSEGVLRASFGMFAFFTMMCVTTLGARKTDEWRDKWHNGLWVFKLILLFLFILLSFFIPPDFFRIYTHFARIGSAIFLLIVLLSTIEFIFVSSEYLLSWDNNRGYAVIIPSVIISYSFVLVAIILMYIFFSPNPSCKLNIFFITFLLAICIILTAIPLLVELDHASGFTSGLMCAYLVYLCFSSIMSEPVSETCNKLPRQTGHSDAITIISFFLSLIGIFITTYFISLDFKAFSFKPRKHDEGDVAYSYGFFHLVFALGSLYMSMLLVGWNLDQSEKKWSMDGGWISVWVKMCVMWLAALFYLWILIAPKLFPDRFEE